MSWSGGYLISRSFDPQIQIFKQNFHKKCKLHKTKFKHEVNEANSLKNRFMRSPAMPPLNNRKLNRITIRNIIFFNELIILFAYIKRKRKKILRLFAWRKFSLIAGFYYFTGGCFDDLNLMTVQEWFICIFCVWKGLVSFVMSSVTWIEL